MTAKTDRGDLLDRLAPEVTAFATPAFVLQDDLRNLERVRRAGAGEATVFYCSRILECLAAAALTQVGLKASNSVNSNLISLYQYSLMPLTVAYWAHALRRIGNDVRHILRRIGPDDAELAAVFLERWLEWFFCSFRFGPRLASSTCDQAPLALAGDSQLSRIVRWIDELDMESGAALDYVCGEIEYLFFTSPTLPAVLADIMISRKGHDEAAVLLERGLACFPDDLRLSQLMGLHWSRTGDLDRALEQLEPIYVRFRDDEETAGIMAGVYKRKWLLDKERQEWLDKSHQAYLYGWKRSRNSNAYLGVNAATTALWLGRTRESRALAGEVEQLLQERVEALSQRTEVDDIALNFWDWASVAEVQLLQGKLMVAWRTYFEISTQHAELRDYIEVSLVQAGNILETMGFSVSAQRFGEPPPARPEDHLILGITGHRQLDGDAALAERVHQVFEMVRRMRSPSSHLALLSPLAEGADRLVAACLLDAAEDASLHVVLPLELAEYSRDFVTGASLHEFQGLLDRAWSITFPAPETPDPSHVVPISAQAQEDRDEERKATYEWCGRYIVDRCHILVALWDGESARGRGGTAEIVQYARQCGRPLVWVHTAAPHEIVCERLESVGEVAEDGGFF